MQTTDYRHTNDCLDQTLGLGTSSEVTPTTPPAPLRTAMWALRHSWPLRASTLFQGTTWVLLGEETSGNMQERLAQEFKATSV